MPARKRRLAAVALVLLAALALLGWLARPPRPRYSVTDLGVLPGDTFSSASGVNNRGEVVGVSALTYGRVYQQRAFLYTGDKMVDLGPDAANSDGPGINDLGQVAGGAEVPGLIGQVTRYDHSRRHALGRLPGFSGGTGAAISSRGQVVGEMRQSGRGDRAFSYADRMIDLGVLPGYAQSAARGVNAGGQIVGVCAQSWFPTQAFICDGRTQKMTPLPVPPGLADSQANGLNDRGEVIGAASASARVQHVLLWQGGRVRDLGVPRGTDSASGAAINSQGEAAITTTTFPNAFSQFIGDHPIRLRPLLSLGSLHIKQQAFVYRAGRLEDLSGLIPRDAGWILLEARGINDRGQIVGLGLHHGRERAFLLTPQ